VKRKQWFENRRFWAEFGRFMFTPEKLAQTPADAGQLVKLLRIQPGERVLDLCCGSGRFALEFARRGHPVTGVDLTPAYLAAARRAACREKLDVEWVRSDMRRFSRAGAFDVALSMCTSFGYFENPADDRRVLANLLASLRPGGRLLMQLVGKEVLARVFTPSNFTEQDGVVLLQRRQVTDDWGWIDSYLTVIKGTGRYEMQYGHRLYSGTELRSLMERVGFRRVKLYGDLDGSPYDHDAVRLVAVGRR
jgi:SAM-dependent methyltransferase